MLEGNRNAGRESSTAKSTHATCAGAAGIISDLQLLDFNSMNARPPQEEIPKRTSRLPGSARTRASVLLLVLSATAFVLLRAQSHRAAGDVTFKSHTSVCGQPISDAVLMMKQGMFRHEMRMPEGRTYINIYDCPRQRLIKVDDHTHTYMVLKLNLARPPQSSQSPEEDAGTLTRTVDLHDTGERRDFFGFTARHIQGRSTEKGGRGACARDGSPSVWIDGWYIDPPVQGCYWPAVHDMFNHPNSGCTDAVKVKVTGIDFLGYAMQDNTSPRKDEKNMVIRNETTSASTAQLDPALFEPPTGYQEVHTYRELYGNQFPNTALSASPATAR